MKLKSILLVLLITALGRITIAHAQEFSKDNTTLTQRLAGFDNEIEQLMDRWNVTGLAIGIVTDTSVVWSKGFGVRNIKTNAPVTGETVFGIGSNTKAFTAAGLGILKDDGKVEFTTPVREYLPEFEMHDEFATKEMTPIDLMTHRSGLPRHNMLWYSSDYSRENLVKKLRYLEPTASFRSEYQYSNLMYMTAGYLTGQVSESSWEEFTRERIFEPLDMTRTTFSTSRMQQMENYARPYKGSPDTTIETSYFKFSAAGPAGSVNSSVSDMNNWLQLFLKEGAFNGTQIIDTTTIAELTQPRIFKGYPPSFVEDYGSATFYALGWDAIRFRGTRLLLHSGNIDGFLSIVGMLPDQEVGWVILTNKHGSTNPIHSIIMFELINRVLDKEEPDWNKKITDLIEQAQSRSQGNTSKDQENPTTPQPSHSLNDYVGTYTNPGYGTLKVTIDGDSLVAHFGKITNTLNHQKYNVFQFSYMMTGSERMLKAQFKMDMNGTINKVAIPMGPPEPIVFTRTTSE